MRRWTGIGFAVFCLLLGSRWLVENAYPGSLPPLVSQGLHFAVVGLVALPFWLRVRRSFSAVWPRLALAGLLLLGVPALLLELAEPVVSQAGAALFTLVPLFVVVGAAALGNGSRALMMPALVGAGGALLLLPFELPSTVYGVAMLGAVLVAVLLTAGASLWMHTLLESVDLMQAVSVVCGVNALVLGVAGLFVEARPGLAGVLAGEVVRAVLFDLPSTVLLLWLLRELVPVQLASRYLFAPLVTVVEGLILLRPTLNLRMGVAVCLMVCGGGALRWGRPAGGSVGLNLAAAKVAEEFGEGKD